MTEVGVLAAYSDTSMTFLFLYKSDLLKRLAEQESFSSTEVMFYAKNFFGLNVFIVENIYCLKIHILLSALIISFETVSIDFFYS